MLGKPATDEFSHMFMGLSAPSVNGIVNPYYNNYYSYGKLITPEWPTATSAMRMRSPTRP